MRAVERHVLSVLIAGLLAGCAPAPAPPPNILLVSLDTMRADAVAASPVLANMSAEGRTFTRAYSAANWTLPAHISLFASLPHHQHQLPPVGSCPPHNGVRIPESQTTLPKVLQKAGYLTGGTTEGGWVSSQFGFDDGFDRFQGVSPVAAGGPTDFEEHLAFARRLIQESGERPVFLFVHTYRVHDYFVNTVDYQSLTTDQDAPYRKMGNLLERMRRGEGEKPPSEYVRKLYDAGVRMAGSFVESLIEEMTEGSGDAPLLVLVTSDHGERLGEREDSWGHGGSMEERVIRIPLIVWGNMAAAPKGKISEEVSLIDIAPSLMNWLGLEVPKEFRGAADRLVTTPGRRKMPVLVSNTRGTCGDSGSWPEQAIIDSGWKLQRVWLPGDSTWEEQCFELGDGLETVTRALDDRHCKRLSQEIRRLVTDSAPSQLGGSRTRGGH